MPISSSTEIASPVFAISIKQTYHHTEITGHFLEIINNETGKHAQSCSQMIDQLSTQTVVLRTVPKKKEIFENFRIESCHLPLALHYRIFPDLQALKG